MARVLNAKFKDKILLAQLKAIDEDIVYENPYGDDYWGVSRGIGKNILGKMLTNIKNNNNSLDALNNYIQTDLSCE